jgi:hypothetical protein
MQQTEQVQVRPANLCAGPRVEEVTDALAAPFDPREVRWKPQAVSGNRALAIAYVDARVIQDRLDDVLGVTGWQDEYECMADGSVVCRLRLRLGDEWITKMDVGGQSEQPDEGDRRKAAFSDALKRAAVKFGVGRYLYRLPSQWVDYDPKKKQFVQTPTLPPSALPRRVRKPIPQLPAPREEKPAAPAAVKPAPARPAARSRPAGGAPAMPANGLELQRRLGNYDARLAQQGMCEPGDLVKHIVQAGVKAGHGDDLTTWTAPAIALAVEEARNFEKSRRQKKAERKEVA